MTWAERSTEADRSAPGLTPLQVWLSALRDLLEDAQAELDPVTFAAFIWVGTDMFGIEAAHLVVQEAMRITDEGSEAAA